VNVNEFICLLPLLVLSVGALGIMMSIAIKRNHRLIYFLSAMTLVVSFYTLTIYGTGVTHCIEPLFVLDGFARFAMGLILLTSLAIVMMSYAYFEQREERTGEYYILLLVSVLGACVLVISKHFISLFLGLEILSVALYGMIAYLRRRERSDEAGLKYLILAAFSSAFLLFGMALVYFEVGTMDFGAMSDVFGSGSELPVILLAGVGLMIVGIGFKLGVVPFHMWTPDVYEGAPAPVTAFIATVSKGGMIVVLVRLFNSIDGFSYSTFIAIFTIVAIASMFVGNLLALRQRNVKRILAYSSISHLGYLLVAFLSGSQFGLEAVCFYLVAYFITSVGAFGVVALLSDEDRDAELMDDYTGLFWTRPWVAAAFTAMLLSLAGIPLTAGFIGKFYLIASGVDTNLWMLVVVLIVNSVIGLYYYIRIIAAMFDSPNFTRERLHPTAYLGSMVSILVLSLLLMWLGIFPQSIISAIKDFAALG
jgi:NADH-quinone oxidoreductase subunit N